MVERYRGLVEQDVDVCIVRDLDSILSKSDANRINAWLKDDGSDVFRYREYRMAYEWSMGGGMAGENRAFVHEFLVTTAPSTSQLGRNFDERILASMFEHIRFSRQTVVTTRMLKNGVYMICSGNIMTPAMALSRLPMSLSVYQRHE